MLTKQVLYYGKQEELPARVELRAGPLALTYEQGDLRYIRQANTEILRRIYVAVRDRNWGTIPPVFSSVRMDIQPDSFLITYEVENRQNEIDFAWQGSIRGGADGSITFRMEGEARSAFWRNRIGFCVLHPANLAGCGAVVEHVDGSREKAVFPVDIVSDQPVLPFSELKAISHEVTPGIWAEVSFSGDIFEMEDQRNWTDASYKTFCTPLRLPYPVEIQPGTRVVQVVTLQLSEEAQTRQGERGRASAAGQDIPTLSIQSKDAYLPLPALGLGMASHNQPLTAGEQARIRALNLRHLRVDLRLDDPAYPQRLAQAAVEARALGLSLEVGLFASERAGAELQELRRVVDALRPPVCAWLCYPIKEQYQGGSPTGEVVQAARGSLASYDPSIPFCAGTNTDFIFLKRSVPPLEQIEQVTFSICPQVHAFDNASLVETLEVQGTAVRSARRLAQGKPVMVSPVTLKMRFNPYATGPVPALKPGELPPQVDVRQMSLFGAAWTAGSFKSLTEAGVNSITYYETSDWRGVMETTSGSPVTDVFRSLPGSVYPLYHVLASIGDFAGGTLTLVKPSHPLAVNGLLLRKEGRERLIVANMTAEVQKVRLENLSGPLAVRILDETNVLDAMQSPEAFRQAEGEPLQASGGIELELRPYAVGWIDHTA